MIHRVVLRSCSKRSARRNILKEFLRDNWSNLRYCAKRNKKQSHYSLPKLSVRNYVITNSARWCLRVLFLLRKRKWLGKLTSWPSKGVKEKIVIPTSRRSRHRFPNETESFSPLRQCEWKHWSDLWAKVSTVLIFAYRLTAFMSSIACSFYCPLEFLRPQAVCACIASRAFCLPVKSKLNLVVWASA